MFTPSRGALRCCLPLHYFFFLKIHLSDEISCPEQGCPLSGSYNFNFLASLGNWQNLVLFLPSLLLLLPPVQSSNKQKKKTASSIVLLALSPHCLGLREPEPLWPKTFDLLKFKALIIPVTEEPPDREAGA